MKPITLTLLAILFASLTTGCAGGPGRGYDAEKCQRLLKEAEDLRGKPIRRSAKVEQYDLECGGG